MAVVDGKLFFERVIFFAELGQNDRIETKPFLEAAQCIVKFVELFGTTFRPVKKDIEGNIMKLTKLFESDPDKFKYLDDIVRVEKETLQESEFHIGTDALTWLNRALLYNQIFLSLFCKEYQSLESVQFLHKMPDNIQHHFSLAYELTLKKYHNWFVQKIFSMCLMAAPDRGTLLACLGYYNVALSEVELCSLIISTISKYLVSLKANTEAISVMLLSHGYQP